MNLAGIYPPIVTPFLKDDVAHHYLAENVEKLSKSGIKGLIVLGSILKISPFRTFVVCLLEQFLKLLKQILSKN